jgi:hypothetical protein
MPGIFGYSKISHLSEMSCIEEIGGRKKIHHKKQFSVTMIM